MVNEKNSDSELKDSNSQRAIATPYPPHAPRYDPYRSPIAAPASIECAVFRPIAI
jgi:hypothetical protein